jgi:Glycosyl hydrolases family 39
MNTRIRTCAGLVAAGLALAISIPCAFGQVRLVERAPDPHGSPRPGRGARDVPMRTSIYFELEASQGPKGGDVDPDSVLVSLQPEGGVVAELLRPSGRFAEGCRGWLRPKQDLQGKKSLAVYIEPAAPFEPSTAYDVVVKASVAGQAPGAPAAGRWNFTTGTAQTVHAISFPLNLKGEPVRWQGQFFSGVCNIVFCTQAANFGPTYGLMAEARKQHPRAWSFQRDFWTTGTEFRPSGFLPVNLPNVVRERETRRIAAIEPGDKSLTLRVEDFFGHQQYGIADGRPVGEDFHPGDEVLIADGVHDARTKVIAADSAAGTVTVASVVNPPGGWKIAYEGPLPEREDTDAPGLFAPGGCYLRKFKPHGTACYYWGRLDKEWDLAHQRYGRRLLPNLADAPGDLSRDGRSWTTVKDYAQWHEVARTIAGHVIDRYGAESLGFTWSVFNEPDLGAMFWRADWNELQTFYDYATDAVLRAFEDRGYASDKVMIGGLELGGIFGVNLKLTEFLAHCSPTANARGALPRNAAFADSRLDGKRSRRVEALCRAHAGKGTPCDFISIHSYNKAELMAAKLIRAKGMALEIDPVYYRALWVNSNEACPDWMPPPDEAAADAYLGNGFFPTWCLDVVHRQLVQAARDPRYAYGETILTVWPPPANFAGINAVSRVLHVNENGDGRGDRTVTVPMPIFHVLGLLSDLGDRYWVLPARVAGGHRIGGFASRDDEGVLRLVLYTHQAADTQSRSGAAFEVIVTLDGLDGEGPFRVQEYHFDRERNSPFKVARALRDRSVAVAATDATRVTALIRDLEGSDRVAQREALAAVHKLDAAGRRLTVPAILKLAGQEQDRVVRELAKDAVKTLFAPTAYTRAEIEQIQKLCECRPTGTAALVREGDGRVRLRTRVAGNGCVFLKIESEKGRGRVEKVGGSSYSYSKVPVQMNLRLK